MSKDILKIENGKYTIELDDVTGNLSIYRFGEPWLNNPNGSKMLIAMMYEILNSRKLLSDISFDFDPDKELGPKCGPDMFKKINNHFSKYYIKLNEY